MNMGLKILCFIRSVAPNKFDIGLCLKGPMAPKYLQQPNRETQKQFKIQEQIAISSFSKMWTFTEKMLKKILTTKPRKFPKNFCQQKSFQKF